MPAIGWISRPPGLLTHGAMESDVKRRARTRALAQLFVALDGSVIP